MWGFLLNSSLRCALLDTSVCSGWRGEKLLDFAVGVRWLFGVCSWRSAFCIVLLFLLLSCCFVVGLYVLLFWLLCYFCIMFNIFVIFSGGMCDIAGGQLRQLRTNWMACTFLVFLLRSSGSGLAALRSKVMCLARCCRFLLENLSVLSAG